MDLNESNMMKKSNQKLSKLSKLQNTGNTSKTNYLNLPKAIPSGEPSMIGENSFITNDDESMQR